MTTPIITPATPPTPKSTSTAKSSTGSGSGSGSGGSPSPAAGQQCDDDNTDDSTQSKRYAKQKLRQAATAAIIAAARRYQELDQQALQKGQHFDDHVRVEGVFFRDKNSQGPIDIDLLGSACQSAKQSIGRVQVEVFGGKVYVRQVASGYAHGDAVGEVYGQIRAAIQPYSDDPHYAVLAGTDGMYGNNFISAPDAVIHALRQQDGEELTDSPLAPLFVVVVELDNRSFPALTRHMGMLLTNFPNSNGVLGIKGGELLGGVKFLALVLIEWREIAIGGEQEPVVTQLIDFGPDELSRTQRDNVNWTLQLPLPPFGTKSVPEIHGAGVAFENVPEWRRCERGRNAFALPEIVSEVVLLPLNLLLHGAVASNGQIVDIPGDALPAKIVLTRIVHRYFRTV